MPRRPGGTTNGRTSPRTGRFSRRSRTSSTKSTEAGARTTAPTSWLSSWRSTSGSSERRAFPKNDHGEPDVPFKWLKTVVTTTAIDMHRKQEARPAEVVDFGAPAANGRPELVDALRDLATPSLISMRGVAAQQALDLLAADYPFDRDLLYWRYIRGVDLSEIAARIGKSREATKKAVQRAVARLRTAVLANDDLRMALLDRPEYPIE